MSNELPGPRSPETSGMNNWMDKLNGVVDDVSARVRDLIGVGNVRRLVVEHQGRVVVDLPLTVAAIFGFVLLIAVPWAAVLGVIIALVMGVRARIEGGDQSM